MFIVIRATAMTVMSNDVFKSFWEDDIYELGSHNYNVRCNQVTLVGAMNDEPFYKKLSTIFQLYFYKMLNEECTSGVFLLFYGLVQFMKVL